MRKAFSLSALLLFSLFICAQRTTVHVDSARGFDETTKAILQQALHLMDSVINSDEFRQRMLSAKFKRSRGFTNNEIHERIKSGNEHGKVDQVINLHLVVYYDYAGGKEVGHTTGDTTYTYKEYITENGAACYAAHLIHEYCHVLGFSHPTFRFLGNTKRLSVPYVAGNIAEQLLGVDCP